MKKVHINVTERQHKELKAMAKEYEIAISEIVRAALDSYLKIFRPTRKL